MSMHDANFLKLSTRCIAVLMTCYNRREVTVRCLKSLARQNGLSQNSRAVADSAQAQFSLQLFIVDDASKDGTAAAAAEAWPGALIIPGNGQLYWCGGMRLAWQHAQAIDPDYYLLLNDDTILVPEALAYLLELAPSPEGEIIAVAPIADPKTGHVIFGGHIGHNLAPLKPRGFPETCDTLNANCALVSRAVYKKIGKLHWVYSHSMGDFDYGFKAKRSGINIIQASKILGFSSPNSKFGTWRDSSLSKIERLKLLWFSHTKGLPIGEWLVYCLRNYGMISIAKWLSPTIKVVFSK